MASSALESKVEVAAAVADNTVSARELSLLKYCLGRDKTYREVERLGSKFAHSEKLRCLSLKVNKCRFGARLVQVNMPYRMMTFIVL